LFGLYVLKTTQPMEPTVLSSIASWLFLVKCLWNWQSGYTATFFSFHCALLDMSPSGVSGGHDWNIQNVWKYQYQLNTSLKRTFCPPKIKKISRF
jgi:hypothetical protein